MIHINRNISLDESEIEEQFVRSSGPGGQNVNKVATAVQLRFNIAGSKSIPEEIKKRLFKQAGNRITEEGILIINAHRHRTQAQNRKDALDRLVKLIRNAARKPKIRRITRPTLASIKRRLENKRHISRIKKLRGRVNPHKE